MNARADGFTLDHLGPIAPVARPIRLRRTRPTRRLRDAALLGACLVMAALAAAAALITPARRPAAPPSAPAPVVWLDIDRPLQLFALGGSSFARLPMTYTARRKSAGLQRQDVLSFGAFGGDAPFLRLAVTRLDAPLDPPTDLVVGSARLAATGGLALLRAGLPTTLSTRFGGVEVAEVTLGGGTRTFPCLSFRLAGQAGPIAMAGLACGTADRPVDRGTLACVIDRIDLVSAGEDEAMRDAFVAAERRRTGACAALRASRDVFAP